MSCPRYAAFALLAALAAAARGQAPQITRTPAIYPVDEVTVHGAEAWHAARIVDGFTGAPIAGAEVLFTGESSHPLRGDLWWHARAVADADGFVRHPAERDAGGHMQNWLIAVRAPGYGPVVGVRRSLPGLVVALPTGQALPVRVRDWRGSPVADVLVGLCHGCGHTSDFASARTDATGLATLRDVNLQNGIADLYAEHPALELGYEPVDHFPGEATFDWILEPGVTSVGVVVDPAGQPVAGAFVGTHDVHRGPWTRTGADGSFQLCGAADANDLFVHVGERELIFERPAGSPLRLQLPEPNGEKVEIVNLPRATPPADAQAIVFVVEDENGHSVADASIRWIGPGTDRTEGREFGRHGRAVTDLRPGTYEVFAAGLDHAETRATIEVRAGAENEFRLVPAPLPTCFVRALDLPRDGNVELRTRSSRRDITKQVVSGEAIGVPAEPFWIVLRGDHGQRRVFPCTREQALAAGTLRLPWFRPTRIEGRVVDDHGRPHEANIGRLLFRSRVPAGVGESEAETEATGSSFSLTTDHEGLALLVVRSHVHRLPRFVPVIVPPRGDDAHVDVGTIVLGGPPRLVLQDAAGEPLTDAKVALRRPGWHELVDDEGEDEAPVFPVDAGGEWFGPPPLAGDAIVVAAPAPLPAGDREPAIRDLRVLFPIRGEGPWILRLPAGELDVRVTDERDEPIHATVFVAAEHVQVTEPVRLRRVPPGRQRLFVAAADRQSAVVDLDVPATGRVAVKVALPRR